MRVCHVTSIHQRYDTRIFQKECISLYKAGYEVFLLVNDENDSEVKNGVQIISTGKTFKNRIDRFINLKQIMFSALMEMPISLNSSSVNSPISRAMNVRTYASDLPVFFTETYLSTTFFIVKRRYAPLSSVVFSQPRVPT